MIATTMIRSTRSAVKSVLGRRMSPTIGSNLTIASSFVSSFSTIPETMRAALVHEPGPAANLVFEKAWPTPSPDDLVDGEVIVKNR